MARTFENLASLCASARGTAALALAVITLVGQARAAEIFIPDDAVPDGLAPGEQYHLIFASSRTYTVSGDTSVPPSSPTTFGGLEAADYQMTYSAALAGGQITTGWIPTWDVLTPLLKAVLSTENETAKDRLSIEGPVYNTNGERVADDAADLWSGSLQNAIGFDENGSAVDGSINAWTGSLSDGSWAQESCDDWENPSPFVFGRTGLPNSSANWVESSTLACNSSLRLYGITPALTTPGTPGDFNGDSIVDGADFLVWQRDTSVGSLSDWEAYYGALGSAASTVPEPASLTLALAAFRFYGGKRREQRKSARSSRRVLSLLDEI